MASGGSYLIPRRETVKLRVINALPLDIVEGGVPLS